MLFKKLKKADIVTAVKNYYSTSKKGHDNLNVIIDTLDDYKGFLYDDHIYNMEELDTFVSGTASTVLGQFDLECFKVTDRYFQFTPYGITSTNTKTYDSDVFDEVVDLLIEGYYYNFRQFTSFSYDTRTLLNIIEMYDRQKSYGDSYIDDEMVDFIRYYSGIESEKVA